MRIVNLAGIFTGSGFKIRDGRQVSFADTGFHAGPMDIECDDAGIIKNITRTSAFNSASGEAVVDGTGCIAFPGFIDSHTHALFLGTRAKEYFKRWAGATYQELAESGGGIHNTVRDTSEASLDTLALALEKNLERSLSHGVTTIEVKSGYGQTPPNEIKMLRALKQFRESAVAKRLPDVRPTFLGLHALPKESDENTYVDGMIAALATVVKEKLAYYVDAFPELGFFSLEQSQRFTNAAEVSGLQFKIHADEMSDLGTSLVYAERLALSVDHLQKINADGIAALAESKTVATLLPATSFYSNLDYANARALIDRGARVALATDFNPGTAPSSSVGLTAVLAASKLKMTSAEIFCAFTFNAAAALGLENDRGTLIAGQKAHINLYRVTNAHDAQQSLEEVLITEIRPWRTILNGQVLGTRSD